MYPNDENSCKYCDRRLCSECSDKQIYTDEWDKTCSTCETKRTCGYCHNYNVDTQKCCECDERFCLKQCFDNVKKMCKECSENEFMCDFCEEEDFEKTTKKCPKCLRRFCFGYFNHFGEHSCGIVWCISCDKRTVEYNDCINCDEMICKKCFPLHKSCL